MQRILKTNGNIKKYIEDEQDYPFPQSIQERCPKCKNIRIFRKHGFYKRYFISRIFKGYIFVRRYICPCKGCTISLLPDFCLFRKVIAFEALFGYTFAAYFRKRTLIDCLNNLNKENPNIEMSRQLLYFYRKRFLNNINLIESGLRQMNPEIRLPDKNIDTYKKAKVLLERVKETVSTLNSFTYSFFEKTNKSPFALCK